MEETENMVLDLEAFGGEDFPPIVTLEEEAAIRKFYDSNPQLKQNTAWEKWSANSLSGSKEAQTSIQMRIGSKSILGVVSIPLNLT